MCVCVYGVWRAEGVLQGLPSRECELRMVGVSFRL